MYKVQEGLREISKECERGHQTSSKWSNQYFTSEGTEREQVSESVDRAVARGETKPRKARL